jgi:hypothetical protein
MQFGSGRAFGTDLFGYFTQRWWTAVFVTEPADKVQYLLLALGEFLHNILGQHTDEMHAR